MNTKNISTRAMSVIDQYVHFKFGGAVCSVPYWNNKIARMRGALRARVGKGSPQDIFEEVQAFAVKKRVPQDSLSDESLKKILVDENIGIDCSAFAYYVLGAEGMERGKGTMDKHLSFVNCRGIIGRIRCSLRPVENCDVSTFAHDKNSYVVPLKEVEPGDIITMVAKSDNESNERDHILVIRQVDYQNFSPTKIYYSHAVAYPEDGLYGTGVTQGVIEILSLDKPITEQRWQNDNNRIFDRAKNSKTELRRLMWFT